MGLLHRYIKHWIWLPYTFTSDRQYVGRVVTVRFSVHYKRRNDIFSLLTRAREATMISNNVTRSPDSWIVRVDTSSLLE